MGVQNMGYGRNARAGFLRVFFRDCSDRFEGLRVCLARLAKSGPHHWNRLLRSVPTDSHRIIRSKNSFAFLLTAAVPRRKCPNFAAASLTSLAFAHPPETRPGGRPENRPAIIAGCPDTVVPVPLRTTDSVVTVFSRPSGTLTFLPLFPAMNRWAINDRPYGT